jgi:hypothetical protein
MTNINSSIFLISLLDRDTAKKHVVEALKSIRTLCPMPLKDAKYIVDDIFAGLSDAKIVAENNYSHDVLSLDYINRQNEIVISMGVLKQSGFSVTELPNQSPEVFEQVPFIHDDDNVKELLKKAAIAAINQNQIRVAIEILDIIHDF